MHSLDGYQSVATQPPSASSTSPRPPSSTLRLSTPPQLGDSNSLTQSQLMSSTQATISIIKGIAGAGIFALPYAFAQSGLLAGIVTTLLLALLSSHSINLLVAVKRHAFGTAAVTYLDVAQRILGDEAARLASVAVVACSLGVSTAYLDFIRCMAKSLFPLVAAEYGSGVFLVPVLPIIIALCLLRSYRLLSLTALIGDVSIFLGALCVISYGLSSVSGAAAVPSSSSTPDAFSAADYLLKPSTFPLFLSTAAFLFCVHFFILPIEANMQHPAHFPRSVRHSFLVTALFNAAFGSIGLLCFRQPSSVVLDNIVGGLWVWSVKLLLCLDMLFSYAVVFFPGRELIEHALLGKDSPPSSPDGSRGAVLSQSSLLRQDSDELLQDVEDGDSVVPVSAVTLHTTPFPSSHHVRVASTTSSTTSSPASPSSRRLPRLVPSFSSPSFPSTVSFSYLASLSPDTHRNLIRTALVLFTAVLALCVPMFSVVISLVGGLSMTSLGFVFPPVMALRLVRHHESGKLVRGSGGGGGGEVGGDDGLEYGWKGVVWYGGLIAFGVLIMLLTVVTSTRNIVAALQSDAPLESC